MGEHAKYAGQNVKIGTCENIYYLRIEDARKVEPLEGNINPATDYNIRFRLPFPDEDNIHIGGYVDHHRTEPLFKQEHNKYAEWYNPDWISDTEPGLIQFYNENAGILLNMPCYHGHKLPEVSNGKASWNGKAPAIALALVKRTKEGGVIPILICKHCGTMFADTWENVLPYVSDKVLKSRLEKHTQGAKK